VYAVYRMQVGVIIVFAFACLNFEVGCVRDGNYSVKLMQQMNFVNFDQ
jgi:hypothetical protein